MAVFAMIQLSFFASCEQTQTYVLITPFFSFLEMNSTNKIHLKSSVLQITVKFLSLISCKTMDMSDFTILRPTKFSIMLFLHTVSNATPETDC